MYPPPPVALQSLKDLGHLTYRRFLELFRHMVVLLGRVISPSQGLYLHRKTRTNTHALSGIRIHDPSNQPAKTHASNRTATVTGDVLCTESKNFALDLNLIMNLIIMSCLVRNTQFSHRLSAAVLGYLTTLLS
jgi:hypothetical protein